MVLGVRGRADELVVAVEGVPPVEAHAIGIGLERLERLRRHHEATAALHALEEGPEGTVPRERHLDRAVEDVLVEGLLVHVDALVVYGEVAYVEVGHALGVATGRGGHLLCLAVVARRDLDLGATQIGTLIDGQSALVVGDLRHVVDDHAHLVGRHHVDDDPVRLEPSRGLVVLLVVGDGGTRCEHLAAGKHRQGRECSGEQPEEGSACEV